MSKIIPKGEELERSRILAGMTVQQMAARASVPASSIVRAEKGNSVTVTTATGICKALDRTFDDLFQIVRAGGSNNVREGV